MRLVLTVENAETVPRECVLEEGFLTLGREVSCGVRFGPSQTQVSRQHATIQAEEGGTFRLTDESTNGTQVNHQWVKSVVLRSGDLIQLGSDGPRLRVVIEAKPAPPTSARPPTAALVDSTLYNPTRDKGKGYSQLSIGLVLGMVSIGGFFGLLLILMTGFRLGPAPALIGVIMAFLPAPIYLLIWLWLDRYDPEPAWILAGCLIWGAGGATFAADIANTAFEVVVRSATGSRQLAQLLSASVSAPLVEEGAKGLAVLLVLLAFRQEFDGVLDGIVYAGVVALGFATVENVLYYGRIVAKAGAPALFVVFFLRGVLGPFSHAVFTSMTGVGCGIARETHNKALRVLAPLLGYAAAVLLHFFWNFLAALGGLGGYLLLYMVIWAPLFLSFFGVVIWMGQREAELLRRMLEPEVALGLLTAEQARITGSWLSRIKWLIAGLGQSGKLGARRQFLYATTRLALSYWHVERAAAAEGVTLSAGLIPRFRSDVARLREEV